MTFLGQKSKKTTQKFLGQKSKKTTQKFLVYRRGLLSDPLLGPLKPQEPWLVYLNHPGGWGGERRFNILDD